jgi:asparagine synthase (glutamine-hydrolysing)
VADKGSGFHAEWARRSLNSQPLFWGGVEAFTDSQKRRLLSGTAMGDAIGDRSSWDAVEPHWRRYNAASTGDPGLPWMTFLDFQIRLPELLLSRTDRMSMGVGLEIRTPFLDHHLVEFAYALPPALVTRDRTPKYILKRSLKGIVPDGILWGRKQGFSVPVDTWLGKILDARLDGVLDDFCSETGWFTREAVRDVMQRGELLTSWSLVNLALWWNSHLKAH